MNSLLEPTVQCQEDRNAPKLPSEDFQLAPPCQNQVKIKAADASGPSCFENDNVNLSMETGPSNRKNSKSLGNEPFIDMEQVHQDNQRRIRRAMKEKPREYLLVRNKMERKRMEVNASNKSRLDILERKEGVIQEEISQLKGILKRRKAELRRLKKRMKKLNVKKEHDNSIIDCQEELELLNLIPVTEEWV